MEIRSKVIHVKVSLDDLRPSPRKEAKADCLHRLKALQAHKTALSLNIPSDSSPRLVHLRQSLAKAFRQCETTARAETKALVTEKKKTFRYSIDSNIPKNSKNCKTSRTKTSAIKLNSAATNSNEKLRMKAENCRNGCSFPQGLTGNPKVGQFKRTASKVANVKSFNT